MWSPQVQAGPSLFFLVQVSLFSSLLLVLSSTYSGAQGSVPCSSVLMSLHLHLALFSAVTCKPRSPPLTTVLSEA